MKLSLEIWRLGRRTGVVLLEQRIHNVVDWGQRAGGRSNHVPSVVQKFKISLEQVSFVLFLFLPYFLYIANVSYCIYKSYILHTLQNVSYC